MKPGFVFSALQSRSLSIDSRYRSTHCFDMSVSQSAYARARVLSGWAPVRGVRWGCHTGLDEVVQALPSQHQRATVLINYTTTIIN